MLIRWNSFDVPTLHRLRNDCCLVPELFELLLTRRFASIIECFINLPRPFVHQMADSEAIVIGDAALSFCIGPDNFTASSLDIAVPYSKADDIISHLKILEHYLLLDVSRRHPNMHNPGVASSSRLRKGTLEINVIESTSTSTEYPVLFGWSSMMFNHITPNSYSIGYPELMRNRRGIILPAQFKIQDANRRGGMRGLVRRYRETGFKLNGWGAQNSRHEAQLCAGKWRRFTDDISISESFSGVPSAVGNQVTVWRIGGLACRGCKEKGRMDSRVLVVDRLDKIDAEHWVLGGLPVGADSDKDELDHFLRSLSCFA